MSFINIIMYINKKIKIYLDMIRNWLICLFDSLFFGF